MKKLYLASPYTGNEKERNARYKANLHAVYQLTLDGFCVYSPVVHFHEVARLRNLPKDFGFWRRKNETMLRTMDVLFVLEIKGWRESFGVAWECGFAAALDIPLWLYDPKTKNSVALGNKL